MPKNYWLYAGIVGSFKNDFMTSNFAIFSSSILLNYWNAKREPIIKEFLEENAPYLLVEHGEYTAYSGIEYRSENIESCIRSVSFNTHHFFKSTYTSVVFSMLLKMYNHECIGHESAQVAFLYDTFKDLEVSVNDFKEQYLSFQDTTITSINSDTFEIINHKETGLLTSVFLKQSKNLPNKYELIFSVTPYFF